MEKKYFLLSSAENSKLVQIIQIIFGIICIGVAVFWLIFNARSLKADKTLWITILFLTGFGVYQIWAGLGRATRFIEITSEKIRLKKSIFRPELNIASQDIQKIEIFPLNLIFFLKSQKKILLRFGTSYQEINEQIKDKILAFGDLNSITIEIKEEKL
jgi:hypothetical protein